jgi:hypothetical protein
MKRKKERKKEREGGRVGGKEGGRERKKAFGLLTKRNGEKE